MRKVLYALTLLLIPALVSGAWDGIKTNMWVKSKLRLGDKIQKQYYVYSATDVGPGYLMSLKADSIEVLPWAHPDSTIWHLYATHDSIKWGPTHSVVVMNKKGSTAGDSVILTGVDSTQTAAAETLVFAANDTYKLSTKYWKGIYTVRTKSESNNDDTTTVYAWPWNTVIPCVTANDPGFVGVLAETTTAYKTGLVTIWGKERAYLTNTTVRGRPGTAVITTTGAGIGNVSVTAGHDMIGVLLEPLEANTTAARKWVWIHPSQR